MGQTIVALAETDDTTVCVRLSGLVSAEDYLQNIDLPVRTTVSKNGFYNIYCDYADNFEGWSEQAAALSFKNISEFVPKLRRVAYINPPESRLLLMKVMENMMIGECRYFHTGQEEEALAWIKSTPA